MTHPQRPEAIPRPVERPEAADHLPLDVTTLAAALGRSWPTSCRD